MNNLLRLLKSLPLLLLLLSNGAQAFETCVDVAIEGLRRVHVPLRVIPNILINKELPYKGIYYEGTVVLRNTWECQVVVHEFIHAAQQLEFGPITTQNKPARENEAAYITMIIYEQNDDLPRIIIR